MRVRSGEPIASICFMPTQEDRFRALVVTNPVLAALIERLPALAVPDCWITAGALYPRLAVVPWEGA